MPSNKTSSSHHGRINLEQQRKRAKELLLRMKDGTASDQLILLDKTAPTLSDAQWLIARQLGFSSWPRLKAHVDAVNFAARNPDFEASDEARTVHWRCGSDIAHTLKLAGFKGSFKMLTDPLCMGPVQAVPEKAYQAARSQYISQAFGLSLTDVARRFDDEYTDLQQMSSADHCVLWCEADAYDQLFLIRTLSTLEQLPARLEIIQVSQIPGVQRFIGIGQLAPDLLAWLWPQRKAVTKEMLHLARQTWAAYCNASPVALAELAHTAQPSLPCLAPALLRQLQELPGVEDGLSLTERLSLQCISEAGSMTFGQVFAELTDKREPLPFLGDMMFHAMMRPLIDSPTALLIESDPQLEWPRRSLRLTPLGQQVLAAKAYWPNYCHQARWVGGVCIQPGQPHWMIDNHLRPLWRA